MARLALLGALALFLLTLSSPAIAAAQDLGLGADVGAEVETDAETDVEAEIEPEVEAGVEADVEAGVPPPEAPTDDRARARAEFAAGIACVEQHETACAEARFRAALALHDAPAIRYNLASALYDLGRYPEAARLAASVLIDESAPDEVRLPSEELMSQLQAQGGTLVITLSGPIDGAEVRVDDEVVPPGELTATLVRAGDHRVTVTRLGVTASETVSVTAGGSADVALTVLPTAEEAAAAAGDTAEAPLPSDLGLVEDWRLWAVVGGAVAAIAIVVIAVVVASENATVESPIEGNYMPGVLRWD